MIYSITHINIEEIHKNQNTNSRTIELAPYMFSAKLVEFPGLSLDTILNIFTQFINNIFHSKSRFTLKNCKPFIILKDSNSISEAIEVLSPITDIYILKQ